MVGVADAHHPAAAHHRDRGGFIAQRGGIGFDRRGGELRDTERVGRVLDDRAGDGVGAFAGEALIGAEDEREAQRRRRLL